MATNRIYRDTEHAMLGGVCAGIANRFDTDPTLVRIATIIIAIATAAIPVALIYLVLWIIVPAGHEEAAHRPSRDELAEELRDASSRVTEAARILGRSAKQAASEINELQRRPTAPPPVGDEAAGAQAVNEDVLSGGAQPPQDESRPSQPSAAPPSSSVPPHLQAPPPPPPTNPPGDSGSGEEQRPPQP